MHSGIISVEIKEIEYMNETEIHYNVLEILEYQ